MYGLSRVKNHRVIAVKQLLKCFCSSSALTILPLPPSLQTFFTTSTTL